MSTVKCLSRIKKSHQGEWKRFCKHTTHTQKNQNFVMLKGVDFILWDLGGEGETKIRQFL